MTKPHIIIAKAALFLLVVFIITIPQNAFSQAGSLGISQSELDKYKNMKVDQLSDDQLRAMLKKFEESGMSEQELEAMARLQGVPESEITKMRMRINQIRMSGGSSSAVGVGSETEAGDSVGVDSLSFNYLDQREEIPFGDLPNKRIFGVKLFNNPNLTFEPNYNIPTPKNYQLGVGDEIIIDIWGATQQSFYTTIQKNGTVNLEGVGPIYVSGLTIEVANKHIFDRLSTIYQGLVSSSNGKPNTFVQVSLGTMRTIKVSVVGEVLVPGTYTLPATASVFNALYLTGGPNNYGSFRKIQIIRNNKIYKTVDVYAFLLKGNSADNIVLQDQDIVMVPPFDDRVAMAGEFKIEGLFEAKPGESISEIIGYAGNFTSDAYTHRLEVIRKTKKEFKIIDVNDDEFDSFIPMNGDSIIAHKILNRFENKVSLTGAVFRPGDYSVTDGLTLMSLIEKADGLKEDAYLDRAIITRKGEDFEPEMISVNLKDLIKGKATDINIIRDDQVRVFSIFELREAQSVEIHGQVQFPGEFPYSEGVTIRDLILLAGGFKNNATGMNVEISRRINEPENARTRTTALAEIIHFNIDDLNDRSPENAFVLEPYDQVFIKADPNYKDQINVGVSGEVLYPGKYSLESEHEKISDLLERAGGLTQFAFAEGASLQRVVEVTQSEKVNQDVLKKRGLEAQTTQVIGIDLVKILKKPDSPENLYLEKGDILHIPTTQQTVSVQGEALNPVGVPFKNNSTAIHYINASGGFTANADRKKTFVIYPNGVSAKTRNRLIFFKKYPKVKPGSKVVVPLKPESKKMSATQWIGISSSLASLVLLVVTISNEANK
ncbi:SLBB domain-containing protein [Aureibacter tunicatorum]|uniref:Protein involved in polysaccharide export with SLBB domain n=1 Tax=Aureibacter tunicatorum TaxID=866807 RepID=A0AAE4BTU4_9BACT|nr:SLBB domain-containing protein [Aureibacter tunicatorum]MDR6240148.1 protein involved in polysaccharide export with SLBB domain [Aureibacter tunicatorum]BDD05971.1 capsule polysaccharide transporter [Aureibacter tunicatorum]